MTVRSRDTMFTNHSTLVIWTGMYTRGEKSELHKADGVPRARVEYRQSQDWSLVPKHCIQAYPSEGPLQFNITVKVNATMPYKLRMRT